VRLTAPGSPHTFPSLTDSRHGNCRVCRRSRLSAFAAAGRSEPHSVQPTPPEPAPSKSRVVSDSSAHRRETQCGGFQRWPHARSGDCWRAAQPPLVSFPALAATGRRFHMRPAVTPVRWGRREAWRLDFRALSSKTACTVARDGCKQGLAVYSVRSYVAVYSRTSPETHTEGRFMGQRFPTPPDFETKRSVSWLR
jgi:hypothetical protein